MRLFRLQQYLYLRNRLVDVACCFVGYGVVELMPYAWHEWRLGICPFFAVFMFLCFSGIYRLFVF